ncbi:hypothetical protein BD324DRAFT_650245 [Kockovaella imperatae]|uniref:Uncharacterized protein n=1 Tax=Kockovaella imperatae TaxID=4999 RepID=A0A1Y1UI09_9TREE|nr:hypothetical protein BD324DRAFT_650245 [Kockovaella imperatae]ORX37691.1 hypothetical protein BD324DRAFT_650245 [Kockovaella imperatae]
MRQTIPVSALKSSLRLVRIQSATSRSAPFPPCTFTLLRRLTSSSTRSAAYRPPVLPEADLPLGAVDSGRSERIERVKIGLRLFVRYCGWGLVIVAIGLGGLFEGAHLYVEKYKLPPVGDVDSGSTSRLRSSTTGENVDESSSTDYGWEDEMLSWTGGSTGGTSPRLGHRARHALRAAWMSTHWNRTNQATLAEQGWFEPDFMLLKRLQAEEANAPPPMLVEQSALSMDKYLNTVIQMAKSNGLSFPPELSVTRPPGPPDSTKEGSMCDPVVRDLLLLKASNLERMATKTALVDAKEIYERVLIATIPRGTSTSRQDARSMRLAKKVGGLCERIGADKEASQWFDWGLTRAGIHLNSLSSSAPSSSSWFGSSTPRLSFDPSGLSPAMLRATISLLTSVESYHATHAQLEAAWNVQSAALSFFPQRWQTNSALEQDNAAAALHQSWLQSYQATLQLHHASVAHAIKNKSALSIAEEASSLAEQNLKVMDPVPSFYQPPESSALTEPARQLHRDALLVAAESSFTLGRLLETTRQPDLSKVADLFHRAAELDAKQSGRTEETVTGGEWHKYWRNYVRVKALMGETVEPPFKDFDTDFKGRDEMAMDVIRSVTRKFINWFEPSRETGQAGGSASQSRA